MSKGWSYASGDWNIRCDVCNIKVKASKTKERWDGFRVCSNCHEQRHPQDFIRARNDKINVPFSRGDQTDNFITQFGLTDSFLVTDTGNAYIDPSYFAGTYVDDQGVVITVQYVRSFSDSVTMSDSIAENQTEALTDSVTMSMSGVITLPAYIDPTYFASDYIATTETF